jgi:uncharacterized protein (TIGR03000 family)
VRATTTLIAVLMAVPASAAEPADVTTAAFQSLTRGSTLIVSLDVWDKPCSLGTGWLVDREQRLVVTNYHVVSQGVKARVQFAAFRGSLLIHDHDFYNQRVLTGATSGARMLLRHKRTDLAILQLDSIPDWVKPLKLADASPKPNDKVYSIGNSGRGKHNSYFDLTPRLVQSVGKEKWSHGLIPDAGGVYTTQDLEATVVVSKSLSFPGDSGGPLVNEKGELVGVLCSGSKTDSLFIEVGEVREMLTGSGFIAPSGGKKEKEPTKDAEPSAPKESARASARLKMYLPPKGILEVNGSTVPYVGETHTYNSAPVATGKELDFTIRVMWDDQGTERKKTEVVKATAGGPTVEVDMRAGAFDDEPTAAEPAKPVEGASGSSLAPPPRSKLPVFMLLGGILLIGGAMAYVVLSRAGSAYPPEE